MHYPLKCSLEDGDIVVTSAELPELLTAGSTEAEALELAEDALAVVLLTYIQEGRPLPEVREALDGEHDVFVPAQTAAKIAVIQAFKEAGISKVELAKRLDVGENEARRILDVDHPTKLDKLDRAIRALGRRISIDLAGGPEHSHKQSARGSHGKLRSMLAVMEP